MIHRPSIRPLFLLFCFVTFKPNDISLAQDSLSTWQFLPEGRIIQLPANPEEPRTGIRKEVGSARMRLDIGTAMDLLELNCSANDQFRLGLTVFAYALTANNNGLRLQIDALDGFFGGHITFRKSWQNATMIWRMRILHRSAHFVDGHIDASTGTWINNREPIPFTKDFGELVGSFEFHFPPGHARVYSGLAYSTLVRPENIDRVSGLGGVDFRTRDTFGVVFGRPFLIYAAYHLGIAGIPDLIATNVAETGIKFGSWDGNGVRLFGGFQSGLEVFGQYYDVRNEFWFLGFALDVL